MIFVHPVYATCPVCIVAVGSGLWLAEFLGVDVLIASLWIGALITALAIVLADKMTRWKLPKPKLSWTIIFYLLTLATLKIQGKLNNPYCRIWGICKIWLGITVGVIVFWMGVLADQRLRRINNSRVFFPFQKVIIPVFSILLVSLIFYLFVC